MSGRNPDGKKPYKGRKPTPAVAAGTSSTTKRMKKNVEEYFGEIVPTSNAGKLLQQQKKKDVEDYFGSEVDIKIRSLAADADDVDLPLPPR